MIFRLDCVIVSYAINLRNYLRIINTDFYLSKSDIPYFKLN